METLSYVELMERHLAVVAENVGMKEFIYNDCMVYKDFMGELDDADKHKPETPATDRIVAGIKAEEAKFIFQSILDNPAVTDLGSLVDWLEQHANDSAAAVQALRESAK